MTDLTQQMETLARRLDALEVENSQLREQLDGAPAAGPAESRRFGRRNLLRLGGAAAAVGAGSVLLRPGVAGATTGAMQFGLPNDAGDAETTLTSSDGVSTLNLSNSFSGAALRATNNAASGGGGAAISAHTTFLNNTLPALTVTDDGLGGAIFCEVTNENVTSPAIFGLVDAGNVAVFEAENDGTGMGLYSHVENPTSAARPVYALTKGTGQAVLASIANTGSKSAARSRSDDRVRNRRRRSQCARDGWQVCGKDGAGAARAVDGVRVSPPQRQRRTAVRRQVQAAVVLQGRHELEAARVATAGRRSPRAGC